MLKNPIAKARNSRILKLEMFHPGISLIQTIAYLNFLIFISCMLNIKFSISSILKLLDFSFQACFKYKSVFEGYWKRPLRNLRSHFMTSSILDFFKCKSSMLDFLKMTITYIQHPWKKSVAKTRNSRILKLEMLHLSILD